MGDSTAVGARMFALARSTIERERFDGDWRRYVPRVRSEPGADPSRENQSGEQKLLFLPKT